MDDKCLVCGWPVYEVNGLRVTVASGVIHGECVARVGDYRNRGYDTRQAMVLVRRDLRAEDRAAGNHWPPDRGAP